MHIVILAVLLHPPSFCYHVNQIYEFLFVNMPCTTSKQIIILKVAFIKALILQVLSVQFLFEIKAYARLQDDAIRTGKGGSHYTVLQTHVGIVFYSPLIGQYGVLIESVLILAQADLAIKDVNITPFQLINAEMSLSRLVRFKGIEVTYTLQSVLCYV